MTDVAKREQCQPDALWYPGLHLDELHPIPSNEELRDLWSQYTGSAENYSLHNVYGVRSAIHEAKGLASVDLCEVVRDTVMGLDLATGLSPTRRSTYAADFTWFNKSFGSDYEESVVVSVVRTLMHNGLIDAIDDVESIRDIMQKWRKAGIVCVANTATLPGCEEGTIRHTLTRDLPDCFDGIVFPRNHDGTSSLTKAKALELFAQEANIDIHQVPVVHIDDAAHHISGFIEAYEGHEKARWLLPLHSDNSHAPEHTHRESSLAAFIAADEHFRGTGVIQ